MKVDCPVGHSFDAFPSPVCFHEACIFPHQSKAALKSIMFGACQAGLAAGSPVLFGEVFRSLSCKCHAGSWEALAEAICVAELDTRSDAAPVAAAEGCPNRAMSALAARLTASVDFRRRLFHMASTAQLPEETLGACCLPNSHPYITLGTEVFCLETAESFFEEFGQIARDADCAFKESYNACLVFPDKPESNSTSRSCALRRLELGR